MSRKKKKHTPKSEINEQNKVRNGGASGTASKPLKQQKLDNLQKADNKEGDTASLDQTEEFDVYDSDNRAMEGASSNRPEGSQPDYKSRKETNPNNPAKTDPNEVNDHSNDPTKNDPNEKTGL